MNKLKKIYCALSLSILLYGSSFVTIKDAQEVIPPQQVTKIDNRQLQINCLATNIYYEARNQSEKGKIAVAYITINRAQSGKFPNTVCGVVYDKCSFSWNCENWSHNITDIKQWEDCQNLATLTIDNYSKKNDPTHGSLYYHAKYAHPHWKHLKYTVKIKDHLFYLDSKVHLPYNEVSSDG